MIKIIFDFIKENYQFIVYLLFIFIELLIIFIKKPVKVDSKRERILENLPLYIQTAEIMYSSFPKSGLDKLEFVLNAVKSFLRITSSEYDSFIIESVEKILSTPTKNIKEDINEK